MTLIELFFFAFNCACGILLGYILAERYGSRWGVVGALVGFLIGLMLQKSVRLLSDLWHRFRPLRPICRAGRCKSEDYRYVETTDTGIVFKCNCGEKYIQTPGKFSEIAKDGSVRPYMMRSSIGPWTLAK